MCIALLKGATSGSEESRLTTRSDCSATAMPMCLYAICDALLGAANMRDIGYHFPDTAAETLDVDSKILLRKTVELIATKGYRIGNIDATVCAERPKINPHVPAMKKCLAEVMDTDEDNISIKATTTERLGFTGREEGISAYAVVLIERD